MPPRATSESRPEGGAILRLLGGFELRRGGRPTAVGSRKARALLAYLAMRRGQPVARDGLTALLWPDTAPAAGRQSLRQALLLLRRALGPGGIESRRGGDLVLPRDPRLEVDVERFEQATRPTAFGHDVASESGTALAARLYRGELLAGIELADAGPFEEWLATERSRLCDLADQALAHLDRAAERRGDLRAAAQLAERRLQLDDLSEGAGATWVPIAPLGARSIARIAESIVEEGASALARWLRRATTGLPLELTEALALLGDLEALTPRADGSWDIDAAALDAVRTRGLPELVEARVARLPPCARRLLGLAAVAGPCFPLETLARAEGELEPVLASAVETLVERWFLRPLEERWHEADASAPEPGRARVFQFAQRTTRRLLLARIPAARRREMAHRIAAATRGSRRPEPSPVR